MRKADHVVGKMLALCERLGKPDAGNEFVYYAEYSMIREELEQLDRMWRSAGVEEGLCREEGLRMGAGVKRGSHARYSQEGRLVAKKLLGILVANEGAAEAYPYEEERELCRTFDITL